MKGLIWKKCTGYLVCALALALCLSLNFGKTKSANAVGENFIPTGMYNVNQIYYNQNIKGSVTNNQQFTFESVGSFSKTLYDNGSTANWNGTNNLNGLKIHTSVPIKFPRNSVYKFSLTFNIQIPSQFQGGINGVTLNDPQYFAAVVCPTATGKNVILDCKVTNVSEATPSGSKLETDALGNTYQRTSELKEYIFVMDILGAWAVPDGQEAENTEYLEWQTTPYVLWNSPYQIIKIRISNPRLQVGYEQSEAEKVWEEQKQQDQEDRNNVSSTSDQAEGDGDSATQNAEQQTQSALDVVTGFVGAITNMHQTNCKIPNININGMELKDLDFCQTPVPPQLMALVGLGMVFIIVPLAISLVKRMLSLYNEILGGK